jgi:dihydroflavonol-4-reductase
MNDMTADSSRILVTGASGFVGRRVVAALAGAGHLVWGMSRGPAPQFLPAGVTWVRGDLLEPATYTDVVSEVDAVVHLAARLKARRASDYHAANVEGTTLLLGAAARAGPRSRRVVVMSSLAAMGPGRDGALLQETAPCRPETAYGASKLAGEAAAREFADRLHLTMLRPTFVYGPGDPRGRDHLRTLLQPGERRWERGIERMSFVHVLDLARASLAALGRSGSSGAVYLVADPADCGWDDLRAALLAALDGLVRAGRLSPEVAPLVMERTRSLGPGAAGAAQRVSWACDTSRARRDLGFIGERPFPSGVAEAVRSYCDEGFFAPGRWLGRPTTVA